MRFNLQISSFHPKGVFNHSDEKLINMGMSFLPNSKFSIERKTAVCKNGMRAHVGLIYKFSTECIEACIERIRVFAEAPLLIEAGMKYDLYDENGDVLYSNEDFFAIRH